MVEDLDPEQVKLTNEQLRERTKQYALQDQQMKQAISDADKFKNKLDAEIGVRERAISLARQMNDLIQDEAINAETLLKNQRNIRKSKEITTKIGEIESKQLKLRLQADLANVAGQKEVEASLLNQILLGDKAKEGLVKEQGLRDNMNDDIGILDNVLRGIQDIPGLGNLGLAKEMEDSLESAASRAAVEGTTLGTFGKMKALAGPLGKAFSGAIGPTFFALVIKAISQVDKELVEVTKSLNMSKGEARDLRQELANSSQRSGDLFVTTGKILKAQNELNTALGTAAAFSGEVLVQATQLLEKVKLTGEATAGLAAQSIVTGGAFEDTYENALATSYELQQGTGISVDLRRVLEQVGTTTGSLRAQLNGSTEEIAKAVTNAEVLGMNLQTAADAGRALLDFESSINNELEAELLTGKQLNLERARAAALTGDQVTLQNELAANMGTFSEFTKMNVLQQESLAAAIGMSSDQLSDILFKQEVQGKTARELRDLGKEELADRLEATTAQEKFNAVMGKLQSIIADVITPLLPLLDMVAQLASMLGSVIAFLEPVLGTLTGALGGFLVGGPVGAVIGGLAGGISDLNKADDMIMPPGYGDRIITSPEGQIALNNNDTIVAGTNLGQGNQEVMMNTLSKDDLIDALRTVEREKPKQNLIIREKDSNYADANPIDTGGDFYQIKYESSFS